MNVVMTCRILRHKRKTSTARALQKIWLLHMYK